MRAERYAGGGRLPTTHWSLVGRAGLDDAEAKREALGELLVCYMPALQAHLVYGKRFSTHEADDLLQEFIASRVIEKDLLSRADRQFGRFRTFLLTALDRFVIDRIRAETAKKRAPDGRRLVGIGDRAEFVPSERQPSDAFDVAWARNVIAAAMRSMQEECDRSNRPDLWGVFECRIADPALKGTEPVGYEQLVERFGMKSPSQASNVLVTAKRMFARALRSVVGQYALDREEIELEIGELKEIFARAR